MTDRPQERDIVERLREAAVSRHKRFANVLIDRDDLTEAAAEIARLRALLAMQPDSPTISRPAIEYQAELRRKRENELIERCATELIRHGFHKAAAIVRALKEKDGADE